MSPLHPPPSDLADRRRAAISGSTALVTGGARGIGAAIGAALAGDGARVILLDVDGEEAERTAASLRELGLEALAATADVTDQGAVRRAVETLGPVRILVNNAGVRGGYKQLPDIDPVTLERMFAVHVHGAFFCLQAVLPGMSELGGGMVVNIASQWGMTGHENASHYCAAKAALLGATKAWARELAPRSIQVNAVAPGGVLSAGSYSGNDADAIRAFEAQVPAGRWASPEEIAGTVLFLVSPAAGYFTGQVLSPNGGETIV
jgi:3-oxoacyl-[acyl-carrier protein] reductase